MAKIEKNGMQKITPFLWFDNKAEEAAKFYVSIFKNSKMGSSSRYSEEASKAAKMPEGSVMVVSFWLEGQEFMAINGGPAFKFSPAISFMVNCETQEEIDYFWEKLSQGGKKGQCGWLDDKYGVSWQVTPTIVAKSIGDKDPEKSRRVMKAVLKMTKIKIKDLEEAYNSE